MNIITDTIEEAAEKITKCVGYDIEIIKAKTADEFAAKHYNSAGAGGKFVVTQSLMLGTISPLFRWFESKGVTKLDHMSYLILKFAWCKHHNTEFNFDVHLNDD